MSMSFPARRTIEVDVDDLTRLCRLAARGEEHVGYDEQGRAIVAIRELDTADDRLVRDIVRQHGRPVL